MKTNNSFKHFPALLSLQGLAFLLLLILGASQVQAAGYSIECDNVDDPNTCRFVGKGAADDTFASLAEDLFEAVQGSLGTGNVCSFVGPSMDIARCDLGDVEFGTNIQIECQRSETGSAESISCGLLGLGEDGETLERVSGLLDIDCDRDFETSAGSCAFSSSASAYVERLATLGVPRQLSSFAGNLLAGCALHTGTDAFRNDCEYFVAALANGDVQRIADTLATVIPRNVDFAMDSTFRSVGIRLSHVTNRLRRLRHGAQGADVSAIQFFDGQQWLTGGQMVAANSDTMSDASPSDEFSRLGFFVDGSIVSAEQDASQAENDAELDSQMFTAGIDYRITDALIGGVAFSVATGEADYGGNRGELDDQGFLLLAYGTYYSGAWYVDASIGLGGNEYEQTRFLQCSASQCGQNINQKASADFSGEQTTFAVGGGYDFSFGALSVSPYAQIASIKMDIDSYRETMSDPNGAGAGYALDIGDQSRDSLTFSIGTQVSYVLSQNWGVFIPHFDLQLYKENEDDALLVSGRFVGNVGVDDSFQLATNEIDTSYYIVGVGGLFQMQSGSTAFIDVKSMQGNDDIDEVQFTAGWRWEL